jgi:hypothetical protein
MNGDELNEKLEFQKRIKDMTPEERTVAIAEIVYDLKVEMGSCVGSSFSKKGSLISSGAISGVIIAIIEGLKASLK